MALIGLAPHRLRISESLVCYQPLIKTLVISVGLIIGGLSLSYLVWSNFQQTLTIKRLELLEYQMHTEVADYQQWRAQIAQLPQELLMGLAEPLSAHDWMDWSTAWQQAYQQTWPEIDFSVTEPIPNWFVYSIKMSFKIARSVDMDAFSAWQPEFKQTGIVPQSCFWSSHRNARADNTAASFRGDIECTWQLVNWQNTVIQDTVFAMASAENSVVVSDLVLPVTLTKPSDSTPLQANPRSQQFSGVFVVNDQVYARIGEHWQSFQSRWCQWQLLDYDGYGIRLHKDAEFAYIPLGGNMPPC